MIKTKLPWVAVLAILLALSKSTFGANCDLYPIGLSAGVLSGKQPNSTLTDVLNGAGAGNFGWLTWSGSPSTPALIASLTSPGNSGDYVNPDDLVDRQVSIGDWV